MKSIIKVNQNINVRNIIKNKNEDYTKLDNYHIEDIVDNIGLMIINERLDILKYIHNYLDIDSINLLLIDNNTKSYYSDRIIYWISTVCCDYYNEELFKYLIEDMKFKNIFIYELLNKNNCSCFRSLSLSCFYSENFEMLDYINSILKNITEDDKNGFKNNDNYIYFKNNNKLKTFTVINLKLLAKKENIKGRSKMNNEELIFTLSKIKKLI